MIQGVLAVAAAAVVAAVAWRLGALTVDGAIAATAVGGAVFGLAGFGPAVVLVLFFASSSLMSALPGGEPREARRARQVLANGGVAAAAALLYPFGLPVDLILLGAIATATADTWATELGVRYGGRPRSVLSFRPVPPGTSGAVSAAGTLAAALGSATIAATALWLMPIGRGRALAAAIAGFLGALVDSVLGAGLQARYRCPACGALLDDPWHARCSQHCTHVSGLAGLDNEGVNLLSTLAGAGAAIGLYGIAGH